MWPMLIASGVVLPFLLWTGHEARRLFLGVRDGAAVLAPDVLAFLIPWVVLVAVAWVTAIGLATARQASAGPPSTRDVLVRVLVVGPIAVAALIGSAFAGVMLAQVPGWWLEARGYVRCPDRDEYRTVQGSRGPRRIADPAWARPEACGTR